MDKQWISNNPLLFQQLEFSNGKLLLIVSSQWPVGALVFELVAPPLEQI